MAESIDIASAARTPIGGLHGDFAPLAGWDQPGATAIKARSSAPACRATPSTRC